MMKDASLGSRKVYTIDDMPDDGMIRELLKANRRFVDNVRSPGMRREIPRFKINEIQTPHTLVLTCSDSRLDPISVFDGVLGEFFVVRVAGNVWEEAGLAAAEFAVNELGVRCVLVMGHTGCGAMLKAMELRKTGAVPEGDYFSQFIGRLLPSVVLSEKLPGDPWLNAVRHNVNWTMGDAIRRSALLRKAEEVKKCEFLGGVYDIETCQVELWKRDIPES